MPRQARLDAPGTLHHVVGRGIEGTTVFRRPDDREDFLTRLGKLCTEGAWRAYAWALLDNHFHLLLRTGARTRLRACCLAVVLSEPGAFPAY